MSSNFGFLSHEVFLYTPSSSASSTRTSVHGPEKIALDRGGTCDYEGFASGLHLCWKKGLEILSQNIIS